MPGLAREVDDDDLPDAAVAELRAGGGTWAKVIGDFPLGQPRITRTYSAEALAEAARRVHAAGGRIAIHCTLAEVVQDAIEAGFDSLEHGSFLQPDQIDAAVRAGVAWVPTLSIDAGVRGMVRAMGFADAVVREVDAGLDRQPEVLRAAAEAGLTVLAGTDAGMGPHGQVAGEVAAAARRRPARRPSPWGPRRGRRASWLGLPGIEVGAPADLVAYRDDPLDEPRRPGIAPALVLLDGRVVRDGR